MIKLPIIIPFGLKGNDELKDTMGIINVLPQNFTTSLLIDLLNVLNILCVILIFAQGIILYILKNI